MVVALLVSSPGLGHVNPMLSLGRRLKNQGMDVKMIVPFWSHDAHKISSADFDVFRVPIERLVEEDGFTMFARFVEGSAQMIRDVVNGKHALSSRDSKRGAKLETEPETEATSAETETAPRVTETAPRVTVEFPLRIDVVVSDFFVVGGGEYALKKKLPFYNFFPSPLFAYQMMMKQMHLCSQVSDTKFVEIIIPGIGVLERGDVMRFPETANGNAWVEVLKKVFKMNKKSDGTIINDNQRLYPTELYESCLATSFGLKGFGPQAEAQRETQANQIEAEAAGEERTDQADPDTRNVQTEKNLLLSIKKSLSFASDWELDAPFVKDHQLFCCAPLSESDPRLESKMDSGLASWLDEQEDGSVVFVALGSLWELPEADLCELAHALADIKQPVLWALRKKGESFRDRLPVKPILEEIEPEFALPKSLMENSAEPCRRDTLNCWYLNNDQNKMVVQWVNQPCVLKHPAIGTFLSHCGWNSLTEAISINRRLAIVALPCGAEQGINSKVVQDVWEIGLRLWGCVQDSALQRNAVVNIIQEVCQNDKFKINSNRIHNLLHQHKADGFAKLISHIVRHKPSCPAGFGTHCGCQNISEISTSRFLTRSCPVGLAHCRCCRSS